MEQRRAVPPTRATLPIRKHLMAPGRAMNRPNQPTSPDRSSFRKSLSAPALHPSRALQETTKPRHRQKGPDSANEELDLSPLGSFFPALELCRVSGRYAAVILLSLRESESSCEMEFAQDTYIGSLTDPYFEEGADILQGALRQVLRGRCQHRATPVLGGDPEARWQPLHRPSGKGDFPPHWAADSNQPAGY